MEDEATIRVEDLKKWFPVKLGFFRTLISRMKLWVRAVDGVSFQVRKGEIFGLAGESGSGKTTTGRTLLKLVEPTEGNIYFKGRDISSFEGKEMKSLRKKMQIIFQDPYESLNPRMTVGDIIAEPLRVLKAYSDRSQIQERVKNTLEDVQLIPPVEFFFRYPHELSGGQRQRVGIARAFILEPDFVVADEPVSMLDVSIRAEILDLIFSMVEKYRSSFLYITHDLALARHICDRIAIMYLGKIMEKAPTEEIVYKPLHPYTEALISAVPVPDPTSKRSETVIKGEIPSPINPPSGCSFHTRCPKAMDVCRSKEPRLIEEKEEHYVACHLFQ
jgi:oligopeptide/dipeptide ABC transporter ATP-binding protein